jgi:hypothetical protein
MLPIGMSVGSEPHAIDLHTHLLPSSQAISAVALASASALDAMFGAPAPDNSLAAAMTAGQGSGYLSTSAAAAAAAASGLSGPTSHSFARTSSLQPGAGGRVSGSGTAAVQAGRISSTSGADVVPQAAEGSAGGTGSPSPPSAASRPTSARPLSASVTGAGIAPGGSMSGSGVLPGRPLSGASSTSGAMRPLSASGRPQSASLLGPGRR